MTEEQNAELAACPFCGSTDVEYEEGSWRMVRCNDCPAYVEAYAHDVTREQIIAAWNRRIEAPGPQLSKRRDS